MDAVLLWKTISYPCDLTGFPSIFFIQSEFNFITQRNPITTICRWKYSTSRHANPRTSSAGRIRALSASPSHRPSSPRPLQAIASPWRWRASSQYSQKHPQLQVNEPEYCTFPPQLKRDLHRTCLALGLAVYDTRSRILLAITFPRLIAQFPWIDDAINSDTARETLQRLNGVRTAEWNNKAHQYQYTFV